MDLADALSNAVDQERGRWFDVIDPWSGDPTDMRFKIAGPDSATQRRARIELMDELAAAAGADGTVAFEHREAARLNSLAKCVIGWEVVQDGAELSFSHRNVVRVLRAVRWIEEQVDGFAGNRAAFRPEVTA